MALEQDTKDMAAVVETAKRSTQHALELIELAKKELLAVLNDIQGYAKLVEDRLVTPEKDSPVYDTQPVQGQLFTDAFSAAAAHVSPRYYKLRHGSITAYPEAKEQSVKTPPPCVCY